MWASRGLGTAERGGAQMEQLFQRERTLRCFTGDVTWGSLGVWGSFQHIQHAPSLGRPRWDLLSPKPSWSTFITLPSLRPPTSSSWLPCCAALPLPASRVACRETGTSNFHGGHTSSSISRSPIRSPAPGPLIHRVLLRPVLPGYCHLQHEHEPQFFKFELSAMIHLQL